VNESQIKPALQAVPGIAEVASVGGLEKQYQIKVFPPLLAKAGIPLAQLIGAVRSVFQEAGGRMIEVTNRDYQLRGIINSQDKAVVGRGPPQRGKLVISLATLRSGEVYTSGVAVFDEQARSGMPSWRRICGRRRSIRPITRTSRAGIDIDDLRSVRRIWSMIRQFVRRWVGDDCVTVLFLRVRPSDCHPPAQHAVSSPALVGTGNHQLFRWSIYRHRRVR
jgi:hypothetical protein